MANTSDFKKELEYRPKNKKPNWQQNYINAFEKNTDSTMEHYKLLHNPQYQNYINTVISAIMLEYHRIYEGFQVFIPYRYKSEKSELDKIIDYSSRKDSSNYFYGSEEEPLILSTKKITDEVAMKIILRDRMPVYHSSNPDISPLVKEKLENIQFLQQMQEFENMYLVDSQFSSSHKYRYEAKQLDYYKNSKLLVEKIKSTISPNAKELLKSYDKLLADINLTLFYITDVIGSDELIDETDLSDTSDINFRNLLKDLNERLNDKLDLAILKNQVTSLIANSDLLHQLGIKINSEKPKNSPYGYVSYFLNLDTVVGPIECQLQSSHEYEEGNIGYAAHTMLDKKLITPYKIPSLDDEDRKQKFREYVKFISPESYRAEMDSTERGRVTIHRSSDYQTYRNVISEIAPNSRLATLTLRYLDKLYPQRDALFPPSSSDPDMGYLAYDIDNYLKSDEFKALKEKMKQKEPDGR